jgi:hypothetical protein
MFELKPLPDGDIAGALALAERCRHHGEPEDAESMCLDVLEASPDHQGALVQLILARRDLLDRALPGGVERARDVLPRLTSEYDRCYYAGVICERQGKVQLRQRGQRSGFVAYDWFRFAMDDYEAASRLEPERPEPVLRWNACARIIMRTPHCMEAPGELGEHGIE